MMPTRDPNGLTNPTKKFQRRKEDFVCEHCGTEVKGTGYTNHCTKCLWSKHVDVNPGDRAALEICGGMMRPVKVEGNSSVKGVEGYMIVHVCEKCGHERRNRVEKNDDFDAVIALAKAAALAEAQKTN